MRPAYFALWLAVYTLTSAACSGNDVAPEEAKPDAGANPSDAGFMRPDASTPDVTASSIFTYITDRGPVLIPRDLSMTSIAAWVLNEQGQFTKLPGQGMSDGTVKITNVPKGAYYFQIGGLYLVTAARKLDLGRVKLGRPDVVANQQLTTTLSVAIEGLKPWAKSDTLEMYSSNANVYGYDLSDPNNPPMPGATAIMATQGYRYVSVAPHNLPDARKGDKTYVFQMSTQTATSGFEYTALSKSLLLNITVQDGMNNLLMGTLEDVPQTGNLSTHFSTAQFEALIPSAHPSAVPTGTSLYLDVLPGPSMDPGFDSVPSPLRYYVAPGTADHDTGVLTYGIPFPGNPGISVNGNSDFTVSYTLPGASAPYEVYASIRTSADYRATSNIGPQISPISNVKINGHSATMDLSGVTTTPTLKFDPPALGIAKDYAISLTRLSLNGDQIRANRVAFFYTKDTHLTVPPGILEKDNFYFATITARSSSVDKTQAPYRSTLPDASADSLTNLFQP